uniref:Uncharacterized protein n=1 Tax=Haptolina brevifila TaxID=156173 RepID=A0A7S2G5B8_9EUKA|mmetsp:Transcript_26269/g.52692  ORF Transcript_26269/g.52692 Transcript_26269/m.52692 type:complete len:216 (+) Transcript_26269:110-757(+)|eukprot:CAMPEP_0174723034 /NCGR_PEP_ID=MMETSP1094-20130205/39882_1 /TAXON_ID=156173 /ORGANISM="Chrysochromulina brevifilum, Strain UTEX LB 985" /LENGTH=215 /DNA_ID=CAMNT_0015924005 /DNA_START=95 /DNA_END=742 /DNA_ORIENTATION=+
MPATAGKVRMPANNRMQTSASLNTHSIWQNAIGYDPYAAESTGADSAVKAEAAASAHENMKALLALARTNKAPQDEDEKGGWRGVGTLRGGWVTKDLGEVPKEDLHSSKGAKGASSAAIDDMPSSTSSWSSDEEGGDEHAGRSSSAAAAARSTDRKRSREDGEDGDRKKKKKHKDGKKERHKSSKHKKEKHKKEKHKKEKKKSDKHKRRNDDSDD